MKRLCLVPLCFLLVLARVQAQTPEEKEATIRYLQRLQNPDGGFLARAPSPKAERGEPSTLQATVAAVRALHHFGGEPAHKEACVTYVENAFDPASGGFRNVQPDGKPNVITTAVGLMGVAELKLPADKFAGPAVKFMEEHAQEFEEVRMAAAGLEAIGKHSARAKGWLEVMASQDNPDGTRGNGDHQARATGSVVVTVLRLGGKVAQRGNVVMALKAGQRKDGGFGRGGTPGSDLETTYRVVRAFHMLKEKPDGEACRAFIGKCRNVEGGYGLTPGQPSTVGGTYFAAKVLSWLDEN